MAARGSGGGRSVPATLPDPSRSLAAGALLWSQLDDALLADKFSEPVDWSPPADLEARLERNPTLERLASEQRIAEARVSLARAQRWPTLKPSLGARRFERTDDWALVASLSLPLPNTCRARGEAGR